MFIFFSQRIVWSPCDNVNLKLIMSKASANLGNSTAPVLHVCEEDAMALENNMKTNVIFNFLGIQFDDNLKGDKELPKNIHIVFRFPGETRVINQASFISNWQTDMMYPIYSNPGPREADNNEGATPNYSQEGFLSIQKEISMQIIDYHLKKATGTNFAQPNILMARFPYPPWIEDFLLLALKSFTGLMLICSFLISATYTIKALTNEKESQIKEAMKIMGLPNWLHWTAWFIKSFVLLFFSAMLVVVLFKIRMPNPDFSVLTLSDAGVIVLLMILYICASITLCFAVSVFFTQGKFLFFIYK